ncbi:MAG: hypothetical protein E7232_09955 [Lachnospiraceae bacterium]|jgi:peptidoglycan/xylan/chitin deacetylase (PgdA/CDA1 family)|nr:hypothetical protein [Lachnospiraceae bacterium]
MKQAIITVDTEAPTGNYPVEKLIYGRTENGKEYGIRALMEMFEKHGYTGLFFVDIAEAWDNGEKEIAGVIDCIKSRGHDVGVHIHPDHISDPNRRFLWEYTFNEQYEIIHKCTELYMKIVGEMPKSFRAGRYGADKNTLSIISELGYKYDFSEFPHNRRCRLPFNGIYNRTKRIENIIEVPVTVFRSFSSPIYGRLDKIDVTQTVEEYKKVIEQFKDGQTLVFFAHSFSLLNWRKNPDNPIFIPGFRKKIDVMLSLLKDNDFNVVSENNIDFNYKQDEDGLISTAYGISQYYYFLKRGITTISDRIVRNV